MAGQMPGFCYVYGCLNLYMEWRRPAVARPTKLFQFAGAFVKEEGMQSSILNSQKSECDLVTKLNDTQNQT